MSAQAAAPVVTGCKVEPLTNDLPFGAIVRGLTLGQLGDEAVRKQLYDLWIDQGVLLFRDGDSSAEMHAELSRCFGPLEEHPFPDVRSETDPSLTKIKYYPKDGSHFDVQGVVRGGWLPWHSDLVYSSRINHGGILRPVQLPEKHGRTGYLCQISAYNRLPEDLRAKIEDLHVVYEISIDHASFNFANTKDVHLLRMAHAGEAIEKRKYTYPRVIHPMVYTQEITGRKVLNVSPGFALGIYEDGSLAGDDLLAEVCSYCMDPQLAYYHDWKQDDMVLWDNWRVLHCAEGVELEDTRVLMRTTISGDYALGKALGIDGPVANFDI